MQGGSSERGNLVVSFMLLCGWGHVGANGKSLSQVEKFELHLTYKKNGESII